MRLCADARVPVLTASVEFVRQVGQIEGVTEVCECGYIEADGSVNIDVSKSFSQKAVYCWLLSL